MAAIGADSEDPWAHHAMAGVHLGRRRFDDSLSEFELALRLNPKMIAAYVDRGNAYQQLGKFDRAVQNYDQAIKLDPKYSEAINNLGTIYYTNKSYKHAISLYKRALKYGPPSASIYANLGAAYFSRKDYKQATVCYAEALKLDPDVFEHHGSFGTLMQERTVEERAMFHLYLAKMYAKTGANARALIYLRKALEEGGNKNIEIVEFPGLNHLFQTANTGALSEYAQIDETIAPVVLDKIATWITKVTSH